MVKIEVGSSNPGKVSVSGTNIDINQIMSRVREFAEKVRQPSVCGQVFAVSVDGFGFSVGKANRTYKTRVSLDFAITRKENIAKE